MSLLIETASQSRMSQVVLGRVLRIIIVKEFLLCLFAYLHICKKRLLARHATSLSVRMFTLFSRCTSLNQIQKGDFLGGPSRFSIT